MLSGEQCDGVKDSVEKVVYQILLRYAFAWTMGCSSLAF